MTESRILRLPEVKRLVGLGRSAIYERIGRGEFPRPVRLGPRSVGWHAAEIEAWIAALPFADAGAAKAA